MAYKAKSKGGTTSSPILTHQSFFYYSQTPAYFVEEPTSSAREDLTFLIDPLLYCDLDLSSSVLNERAIIKS